MIQEKNDPEFQAALDNYAANANAWIDDVLNDVEIVKNLPAGAQIYTDAQGDTYTISDLAKLLSAAIDEAEDEDNRLSSYVPELEDALELIKARM